MTTILRNIVFVSVLILSFLSADAQAHQLKQAITTVLFNPRTDNIEVMHRFEIHDAEHAVTQILGSSANIIDDTSTQQNFSQYVVERFAMFNEDKQELMLTLVGFEVDGKHFWVYQETKAPAQLAGLYIEHNALRDIWQTQTNTINIEGNGDIQTLTFTDNIELLKVSFEHHY